MRSEIEAESRNDLMRIIGGLGIIDNYEMKDEMRGISNDSRDPINQEESYTNKIIS